MGLKEIENRNRIKQVQKQNVQIPMRRVSQNFQNRQQQNFAPQNNFQGNQSSLNMQQRTRETGNQKLIIPEVNLPERFKYLKPTPTQEEIDLGKLNPLIKNPQIREIECNGPDTEIIVKLPMPKKTEIMLTAQEIQDVFAAFSHAAKIPVEENIIKIAAGNLILNGINSNVIGSKFIIKRIGLGMR